MVSSLVTMSVIITNAQLAMATGHVKYATKPMKASNCSSINILKMNETDRMAG